MAEPAADRVLDRSPFGQTQEVDSPDVSDRSRTARSAATAAVAARIDPARRTTAVRRDRWLKDVSLEVWGETQGVSPREERVA
jgi:hypothetical protein